MKGLEEYIAKHGNHFTEELAHKATKKKWDVRQIERAAQKRVYYNVTGTTSGDMIYLMDLMHTKQSFEGKTNYGREIKDMLLWVGDYRKKGSPFCIWLTMMIIKEKSFDFTPYI